MRGTVAKRLRRQAEARTVGAPYLAYVERNKVYTKPTTYTDHRGVVQKGTVRVTTTERRLDPVCTRAVYKALKRAYQPGALPWLVVWGQPTTETLGNIAQGN